MLRNSAINIVLKIALSISLLYVVLAGFLAPQNVTSRWPSFISGPSNEAILGGITSIISIFFIAWLFSGKKKFSAVASVTISILISILFNISDLSYIFQVSPLFLIGLALSLRYYPRIRVIAQTRVTPLNNITPIDEYGDHDDTDTDVVESDIHAEHDQHIFIPKE